LLDLLPHRDLAMLVEIFGWEWQTFWPELAAGLITFGAGVPFTLWLLMRQFRLEARRAFSEFRTVANVVKNELTGLQTALTVWCEQVAKNRLIGPIDPPPLTWDIADEQVKILFVQRGAHSATESAVVWYRKAVEVATEWNDEFDGGVSEGVRVDASIVLPGALSKIEHAIQQLESVSQSR